MRPQLLDTLVLVKPATVIGWHRKGFRIYWRWRSRRSGRSKTSTEIRDLIRRMSAANPLWGAPRIHGELLRLVVDISQATVGRYLPRRPRTPSPTWRSFLHNHLADTAAIDMFIVATATFHPVYSDRDYRRKIIHFGETENPTELWLSHQITEAFPRDTASRYLLRDRDASYGPIFRARVKGMGVDSNRLAGCLMRPPTASSTWSWRSSSYRRQTARGATWPTQTCWRRECERRRA